MKTTVGRRIAMALRVGSLTLAAPLLAGCATVGYTVDDGRPLDERQLADLRTFGKGSQTLQDALIRAAAAAASGCETEWELPFAVVTSDEMPLADRIAWLRALKVDERATVIAGAPSSGVAPGDKLVEVDGQHSDSGKTMIAALEERRDAGRPFDIRTAAGATLRVTPFKVCRGRAQIAAPAKPDAQDYHWTRSIHPHEVFAADPTPDEALWLVLWTQGLSAEGGSRMMAYQYGLAPLRAILDVAAFVSGAGAVARAAQAAGSAAVSEVGSVVARNVATGVAVSLAKQQAEDAMSASSKNRASLEGAAWMAGTMFDKADGWAFERMTELGADPFAAFTLHSKLVVAGSARNAFVLDAERLPALTALAERQGLGALAKQALENGGSAAPSDALAQWQAEPMPQAEAGEPAAEDDFDREVLEPVAALPMEALE